MDRQQETLQKSLDELQNVIKQYGGVSEMVGLSQDMLPKDKFNAEIDGHVIEVSRALSGKAIMIVFQDEIKCGSLYNEIKSNKQGFFKRIFNIK